MRTSLLVLLLIVHPNISLGQAPDQIDAEHAVRTLMGELSQGFITGFAEKPVSRLGDAASVALTKVLADKLPTAKDIENILLVVRLAFARPSNVVNAPDRQPKTTLVLLQYLEAQPVDARLKARIVDMGRFIVEETNLVAVQPSGNLGVEENPEFEIMLPLSIDSQQVQIRYYLTGAFGGYGSFTRSESGKHEYRIPTVVDGQPANTFKAVVYAPGCQIETISILPLSDLPRVADFSCEELPAHDFTGRISQLESLRGRQYHVEINLMAHWGLDFFGIADGIVPTFEIARVIPDDQGVFHVQLPDFSEDRVTRSFGMDSAELQFNAREEGTGNILGMLEPVDVQENPQGNLRLRSDYGGEVRFGIRTIH